MVLKKVYSSDAKYLAATDILIGDMSDINYEFLLFNRPIILLANDWVRQEFPDIGIKCDLETLSDAIYRSIKNSNEYENNRRLWLSKTHHKPDGKSSKRVLNKIIEFAKLDNPTLLFIHGNNEVLYNTIKPLYNEAINSGYSCKNILRFKKNIHFQNNIYISAHNELLNFSWGIKVHLDHGGKGPGVLPVKNQIKQYKDAGFWSNTDLHITEGMISFERTKILLGPYSHKAIMVGFPRSDDYLKLNTVENKISVCKELGFDHKIPLIIYAPAGKYSWPFKQGASLSKDVLKKLEDINKTKRFNIFVKYKHPRKYIFQKVLNKAKSILNKAKSY